MRRLVCAVVISMILTLITLGLQLAGCVTSGWKIIEADGPNDYPWTPYSMQNDGMQSNKATITCSIWKMTFCIRRRCFDHSDFGSQFPKYFEDTPRELQGLSVAGLVFVFFAFLSFSSFFRTLKEPVNCNGIIISILLFMSGCCSVTLVFLSTRIFDEIEEKITLDSETVTTTQVPYSMILVGISVGTSFLASSIVSVLVCKLNQHNYVPSRKEMDDDEMLVAQKNASHKLPHAQKNPPSKSEMSENQPADQKQVVYSIHL